MTMAICGFCGGVIGPNYEATDEERGTIHQMCVAPLAEIRLERARLAAKCPECGELAGYGHVNGCSRFNEVQDTQEPFGAGGWLDGDELTRLAPQLQDDRAEPVVPISERRWRALERLVQVYQRRGPIDGGGMAEAARAEFLDDLHALNVTASERFLPLRRAERAEPAGAEFFASDVDFLDRCLNWSAMPYDVWLARCRDLRDRIRQHIAAVQPQREGDR